MATETDNLSGYRSREGAGDDEIEAEVRALHSLENDGIDVSLVRDVIRSDELVKAMQGNRVVGRLVTYATERLDECSKAWQQMADPNSVAGLNAHREARAARLLIDWIEQQLKIGSQAEKQLHEAENYE